MTINYEIKSQLAKLLATEDLVVEHKNVATAQFNIENRVLTLPMWKRASNSVYDLLVGHEVGHALFTPNDWSFEGKVPQQFVNVTEDARIEKLMKRKYAGIKKSFYSGYEELAEQDFFCIDGEDVDNMNLADRANLHFKIGQFIDVSFHNFEESRIIKLIGDAETFEDAVEAAKQLYAYCKKPKTESQPIVTPPSQDGQPGGEIMTHEEMLEEAEKRETENEESDNIDEQSSNDSETVENTKQGDKEPKVETDSAFEEGIEDLNGNMSDDGTGYYEIPEIDINKIVVPFDEIQKKFEWSEDVYASVERCTGERSFEYVDSEYNKFRKSTSREINYLVKEFECKKSADAYARSATSRTGVLDCSKLHTYKYNEDLFKKVTTLADGKNHGLIFVLDWSGSMANSIIDTIKQLYNLIWFCNKCNIPFDVYAFTNSYMRGEEKEIEHIWEEGKFIIDGSFKMMNLLSSNMKRKDLEKQMQSIFRMVFGFRNYVPYNYPAEFSLSGTPLNEAILSLHKIIPAFNKMHGVQKTHCFVLTDGEANCLMIARENVYGGSGAKHITPMNSYLRNRKTGYTYQFQYEYYKFTQVLLENLKQENKDVNFIGIRLCPPREMNQFVRRYEIIDDVMAKKMKKDKFYDIKNTGYTSYFAMQTSALNNDADFDVEEGASKAKIKSAFVKNLKTKALNKKVLGKFISLVA